MMGLKLKRRYKNVLIYINIRTIININSKIKFIELYLTFNELKNKLANNEKTTVINENNKAFSGLVDFSNWALILVCSISIFLILLVLSIYL